MSAFHYVHTQALTGMHAHTQTHEQTHFFVCSIITMVLFSYEFVTTSLVRFLNMIFIYCSVCMLGNFCFSGFQWVLGLECLLQIIYQYVIMLLVVVHSITVLFLYTTLITQHAQHSIWEPFQFQKTSSHSIHNITSEGNALYPALLLATVENKSSQGAALLGGFFSTIAYT